MKKLFFFLAIVAIVSLCREMACTNSHGNLTEDLQHNVDTAYLESEAPDDESKTHESVDLRLSVEWAAESLDGKYRWGETEPYNENKPNKPYKYYRDETIKDKDGFDLHLYGYTKYITKENAQEGNEMFYDNKTQLDLEDDAAYVNWGKEWRTPTKKECEELIRKCTFEEKSINGEEGSKITGPNGNFIFIPWDCSTIFMTSSTSGDGNSVGLEMKYNSDAEIVYNSNGILLERANRYFEVIPVRNK